MGGPGAPDDMSLAPVTQAWLAVSSDPGARVTVVRVVAWPTRRAISSMLTPWWLMRLTNEVRSSRGVQSSPMPASVQTRLNIFRTLAASSAGVPTAGYGPSCVDFCRGDRRLSANRRFGLHNRRGYYRSRLA
jgi:hypothetical protein